MKSTKQLTFQYLGQTRLILKTSP